MKVKTSVTISKNVLAQIDQLARPKMSRSAFIEAVLRNYLSELMSRALTVQDLARINRSADHLNLEAEDVLQYQAVYGRRKGAQ